MDWFPFMTDLRAHRREGTAEEPMLFIIHQPLMSGGGVENMLCKSIPYIDYKSELSAPISQS